MSDILTTFLFPLFEIKEITRWLCVLVINGLEYLYSVSYSTEFSGKELRAEHQYKFHQTYVCDCTIYI